MIVVDHVLYDWLYCRVAMIGYIVDHVWRFDVRVAMIGYIVDHVLCLEV